MKNDIIEKTILYLRIQNMEKINLDEFKKDEKQKRIVNQEPAISRYFINKKRRLLQINMYGTKNRIDAKPPKNHKSQVLLIDEETAMKLLDLFKECFDWEI